MKKTDFEALIPDMAEHLGNDPRQDEMQRHAEAREVRDRLPQLVRTGTPAELESRISAPELVRIAKTWAWGDGSVLLMGPTRKGKSTAMGYLYRRLLASAVRSGESWDQARWMRWFSAEELSVCRRTHSLGHGEPTELVEATNARLLFLDDAGWDRDPAEVSALLADRYNACRPTIISTGKTPAELSEHYGAPVVARMLEAGGKGRGRVINVFEEQKRALA